MNLFMLLEMAADAAPDRVAVGSRVGGIGYGQLLDRAGAVATRASQADCLALLDLNGPAMPALLFGAAAAGVPFAPLNYRQTDAQLAAATDRLSPVLVVEGEPFAGRIRPRPGVAVSRIDDVAQGGPHTTQRSVDPDAPAILLFTSGTTGEPKAAVLRHRHITSYIISTVEFASADVDEAALISVPNYHIAGLSAVLSSVYAGRRVVQLPSFSAEEWVDLAVAESVTHAMVVPTMLGRILDVLDARDERLPALRHLSYGGGRMPGSVVERAMRLLPHVGFVNAYGLTETSSTIAILGPDEHRAALAATTPEGRARLTSVGRPLPSVEVEVRSADGAVVEPGVAGEVFVRGEQVGGEYTSHSALDDQGWYATRDRGLLDSDGYLFLDGRADDVIVRGGENISPGEVEEALVTHPDVEEAAVIGVADTEWGERVEAFVVPVAGKLLEVAELQSWVRERLRSTRVPDRFHQRSGLPYSETGKLLRRVLRDELDDPAAPSMREHVMRDTAIVEPR
ncbi:fatty acid--CoA ligase family protein [Pseudonocardia xishanensis]|uniref:Acyl-CoA synthetase (AMP-forming)/AMP-acid ligase II n=1 Tax=Pseudonocardia xishanensis TaxID=630995 RepID=A0ABP8RTB2_9PSEU